MRSVDGDVKLSFLEILFSPFASLKNMVTSKNDVNDDIELEINSNDPIKAELAEKQKEIDEKVDAYGGSGKSQRREMLNQTKVNKKDLGKLKEDKEIKGKVNGKDVQATVVEKEDKER